MKVEIINYFSKSILLLMMLAQLSWATSMDELKHQQKELQLQIQLLKQDLSKKGSMYHSLSQQITIANKKAAELEQQVKQLEQQKSQSTKVLHVVQHGISDSKQHIDQLVDEINLAIKKLAYSVYENEDVGSDSADQEEVIIQQHYFKTLAKQQYSSYEQLKQKLYGLERQNNDLQKRVTKLKRQEQQKIQADKEVLSQKRQQQASLIEVKQSMQEISHNIAIYNQKQLMLSNKINSLLMPKIHSGGKHEAVDARNVYEEPASNMVFLKPVNATVITGFGANLPEGGRSKGILFDALLNSDVKAVSEGVVLFSGRLTGFGEVVVIAHKAHYLSVYSGIVSNVSKNQEVSAGQRIGSSGDKSDQPMGGFYFELRHLGVPVKPSW